MRICITAANCFIGLPLVKKASSLGWDVIAVVRVGNKQKDYLGSIPNVSVIELNLEDYDKLGSLVGSVDCAVLLTWNGTRGQTRVDEKLQESNYLYNMEAVKSLVEYGCKRIITAGSQAEYGIYNGIITEEMECKPNTAYGKYKVKLFEEASKYCSEHGVSLKEPRFFSLYGPGDYENTMIMGSIKDMLDNKPCKFTKALQMWDYLYIDDAIEAIAKLCEKKCADGAYNFGSGDCRPLREYIMEQKQILNSSSELLFGSIPYGPAGVVSIHPSVEKLRKELLWEPKTSFSDGINKIVKRI